MTTGLNHLTRAEDASVCPCGRPAIVVRQLERTVVTCNCKVEVCPLVRDARPLSRFRYVGDAHADARYAHDY